MSGLGFETETKQQLRANTMTKAEQGAGGEAEQTQRSSEGKDGPALLPLSTFILSLNDSNEAEPIKSNCLIQDMPKNFHRIKLKSPRQEQAPFKQWEEELEMRDRGHGPGFIHMVMHSLWATAAACQDADQDITTFSPDRRVLSEGRSERLLMSCPSALGEGRPS